MSNVKQLKTLSGEILPVRDAKRSLRLIIKRCDITKASKTGRKSPGHCVAAVAAARQLHTDAFFHLRRAYVRHGNHFKRYETPRTLFTELVAFDRGGDFEPRSFTIPPAPERKTPRKRGKDSKKRKHVSKGILLKPVMTKNVRPQAGVVA